jgi:hypothetical protein
MTTESPQERPEQECSLFVRKAGMFFLGVPLVAAFALVLLQYKGIIDLEGTGISENNLFLGGFGVVFAALAGIFAVWRCPGCGAYLGKEANPSHCPRCHARFR